MKQSGQNCALRHQWQEAYEGGYTKLVGIESMIEDGLP